MSAHPQDEITEETILEAVSALRSEEAALSPLGAAILAALHFGIATDSRTFSRKFDIAHALALREITALSDRNVMNAALPLALSQRKQGASLQPRLIGICFEHCLCPMLSLLRFDT